MRRSRRNGQLRRVSSMSFGSHVAMRIAGIGSRASVSTRPNGSAMNEWPKNSMPLRARLVLVADAVRRRDEHAVGDRVRALDRAPRVDLRRAELRLLGRMPADRRRIEENVGAEERRDARGLRIPLIPADQHADVGVARVPDAKAARLLGDLAGVDAIVVRGVAGREIVLLVEQRIVGDVHLPIHAEQRCRRRR